LTRPVEHADVDHLTPEAWRDLLIASVEAPEQDGLTYPGFPEGEVQRQFVGSEGRDALGEAYRFYDFAAVHGLAQPRPPGAYLDFGCGWGRIGRFFLRDFPAERIAGVDVDPDMIAFCREAGMPGAYHVIENGGGLPFADGSVALATAYSVFTHLAPPLFQAWMAELLRVLAPGGRLIITVEPPRFLDFIEGLDPDGAHAWHASFAPWKPELPRLRRDLETQGIAYLATGGGAYREAEVYGETVVDAGYLQRLVAGRGRLDMLYDDPAAFWQAVAVITRQDSRRTRLRTLVGRLTGA
jgi:SAM-dependent methyltransferase